ncbi:hypothetical protein M9Y10_028274 [Tritrichomonas musculus]|uniref:Importin N-terminal domain-containing protein n=1 Tax=Tritrichomonas musculus TaxID=1915356 RepID=A0ABR2KIV6_9EUKA
MTNIADLYLQALIPDNNTVAQATSALLEKYNDANSIFQVLEILQSNSNPLIRRQAAIGLKTILHNFWYGYSKTPSAQNIIDSIINSLKNESEQLTRHLIIYALDPICSHREDIWPRLIDDLALNCIQSDDLAILDIGLSLYEMIIPHLKENLIGEVLPPLSEKIAFVFQAPNDLIPTSSNLILQLFKIFTPNIPECLVNLVEVLFTCFRVFLQTQHPQVNVIANNLSEIVSMEGTSTSTRHLIYLLEVANDPSIPPFVIHHIFTPIEEIIKNKYMVPFIYKYIPDLLSTVFKCASLTFIDDCITEQSDSSYIYGILDFIQIDKEEGNALFSVFSQLFSNSSIQVSFSSLLAFQFFIDNYPHIVTNNLKQMVSFLIEQSTITNHHCLCEQSMICIHYLINVVNGGLIGYSDSLLQAIINAISVDHDQLVIEGLTALSEFFRTLDFDHSLISNILNLLISKIRKSPEIMNGCISALNAIILVSGSDISPFATQLAPLFFEIIQMSENRNPQMKSYASESIAGLLKNAPAEMSEFLGQSMQLMIQLITTSEDPSDLDSAISVFLILADSQIPQITSTLQIAMEKSIRMLQIECPAISLNENDVESSLDPVYSAKQTAMKFINSFVIAHPESFASCAEPITNLLITHINECYEPHTRLIAIKTLASFGVVKLINPANIANEFLQMDLLYDDDPMVVTKVFSSVTKFLSPEIPPEILSNYIEIAIKGLRNKLQCQAPENIESYEFDSYEFDRSIFKFFSKIAQTHINIYPVIKLLQVYTHKVKKSNTTDFIILEVASFANYLIAIKKSELNINEIIPPQINQIIVHSILNSLKYCNGTTAPLPLFAVKELFKAGVFDIDPSFTEPTFQAINLICSMENAGQPTFDETIAATASLLFVLFSLMGENFNVQNYLNFMISSLPIKFKRYAEDVYLSLIQLFQKYPQVFTPFVHQIILGVAKTLALSDGSLTTAGLSIDVINQLSVFFKALITNVPESNQIISETITNQNELNRLTHRISQ